MKKAICGMMLAGAVSTWATWAQDAAQNAAAKAPATNEAAVAAAEAEAKAPKISEMNKASSFVGSTVVNTKGEAIGKVKELVIDLERGTVGYAVVELNSQGENRNLPVPLRALKPGQDQKQLVLNISDIVLAAAEGYKDGELPAADTFAVGSAAGSETGRGSSEK